MTHYHKGVNGEVSECDSSVYDGACQKSELTAWVSREVCVEKGVAGK